MRGRSELSELTPIIELHERAADESRGNHETIGDKSRRTVDP